MDRLKFLIFFDSRIFEHLENVYLSDENQHSLRYRQKFLVEAEFANPVKTECVQKLFRHFEFFLNAATLRNSEVGTILVAVRAQIKNGFDFFCSPVNILEKNVNSGNFWSHVCQLAGKRNKG